jgi:putative SOS response-associated peptidase YedK
MCGRFVATSPLSKVAQTFATDAAGFTLRPSYNVAPTTVVAAVVQDGSQRRIDRFVWGLMPAWRVKHSVSAPLINARAETIDEKPSFRHLVPKQRCVVPMDGYYEWLTTRDAHRKIPFFITRTDSSLLAVAGLWDHADDKSGGLRRQCIATVAANAELAEIHDRMPAVLEGDAIGEWLDGDPESAVNLLVPAEPGRLWAREVSTRVNSVRNDDPTNIDPVESQTPPSLFD